MLFTLIECDSVTRALHLQADHDQREGQPGTQRERRDGHHANLQLAGNSEETKLAAGADMELVVRE
jgi:hypothetical protein